MEKRHETREQREDRLLHQSFLDDVSVQPLGRGRYAMHSAHTPKGVRYIATARGCTCKWGQEHNGDGLRCKHQIRAAFEQSFLLEPPPAAPAVAADATERFLAHLDQMAALDPDGVCDWMTA